MPEDAWLVSEYDDVKTHSVTLYVVNHIVLG